MKKALLIFGSLSVMIGLSACGSSAASEGESTPTDSSITISNNNTDPYSGWVKLNPNERYPGDVVYLRCTAAGTGIYRTWDNRGGLAAVANSADCPKR